MKTMMFIRPPFNGMDKYIPPHLGIATLYSYLNSKFAWIKFSLVDALADGLNVEEVVNIIEKTRPDILAFTVKTMQNVQTKNIILRIRQIYNPLIICGGNHVSVSPLEFIKIGADYALLGEGEQAIEKIINFEYCHSGENLNECSNICTKNTPAYFALKPCAEIAGNGIVTPDWSLFNLHKYNENIHMNKDSYALPIMASRGCPFKCDFCSTHLTWTTQVRYRKAIDVVNEIKQCQEKWGISDFHFYDDNLLINFAWVSEFVNLIGSMNLKINWICLSRPDIILKHKELLLLMKAAGCKGFELGFETDDDGLYVTMNKKNVKSTFRKAYEVLCDTGFEMIEFLVMSFYIGETLQSLYKTNLALRQYKKQRAFFVSSRYFATPFKGTEYLKRAKVEGIDLYPGDEYRYAIFLNYMPKSFLTSSLTNFSVNSVGLKFQYNLLGIDNIIYKNEFEKLMVIIPLEDFAQLVNELSKKNRTIQDLCNSIHLLGKAAGINSMLPIYEYVGRIIEFCIATDVMKYNL